MRTQDIVAVVLMSCDVDHILHIVSPKNQLSRAGNTAQTQGIHI